MTEHTAPNTEHRLCQALAFARSVIKSGESWTQTCEEMIDGALAMPETPQLTPGMLAVVEERLRQITEEGWSAEHDDKHDQDELARAAACYATPLRFRRMLWRPYATVGDFWPWARSWWKPDRKGTIEGRKRELVKATALLLAEIERLERKEKRIEDTIILENKDAE